MPRGETELHAVVKECLSRAELRYTDGRRAVVDALVTAGHPVSIGDLAAHLPDLPRSSAYRHLVDLQGAGVVRRVSATDEFARYELAEDLTGHHHHFLCTSCGTVSDITPSASFELAIRRQVDRMAELQGFEAQGHRMDVVGLCSGCR